MNDDIDKIPLKSLPYSGVRLYEINPNREDDTPDPDNVLMFAIGKMKEATVIGRGKDGNMYFASSMEDPREVHKDLEKFLDVIEGYFN